MQHRIYKCPHSGLSGCPHLRGVAQYAFYVNQSGPRRSVRLIEVSVFRGVRIEGFHYISNTDLQVYVVYMTLYDPNTDLCMLHEQSHL